EPGPFRILPVPPRPPRVLVAPRQEAYIPRRTLLIEPLPGDKVRLRNVSLAREVHVAGDPLLPDDVRDVTLPTGVRLGSRLIQLERPDEYVLAKRLSVGWMSDVVVGIRQRDQAAVALKIYSAGERGNPSALASARRVGQLIAHVEHPRIVRILG